MADFFEPEETQEGQEEGQEESKVKIGEEEFSPEELEDLVGRGKFAREVEEKYNTKIDKVWPEYTKATQELKVLKEEKEAWTKQQESQPQGELSEEDLAKQARQQAKKLGLVTIDDIDSYVSQKVTAIQQASEMLNTCKSLETDYNGGDGRPKFSTEDVLEHMKETGIRDPLRAYKDKYEEQLDKWKEQQLANAKKPGLYTEGGSSGNKEPTEVKLDSNNLEAAVREALSQQG